MGKVFPLILKLEKLQSLFITHDVLKLFVPQVKAEGCGVQQRQQPFSELLVALLDLEF
ncbi:hypothetical protein SDC9_184484 [bioreactor metagenome]|uniref:Uncharacterized protein n=1 Tax=bioreactor metagenome TaxID=1076179 RepID=A0A645HF25_9ZZZZ